MFYSGRETPVKPVICTLLFLLLLFFPEYNFILYTGFDFLFKFNDLS